MNYASQSNHELARESMLCMSGHARRVPKASVHPAVRRSCNRQTRTVVTKVSCRAYYQCIQLEYSSLSLSFMSTLQSDSSPSHSFKYHHNTKLYWKKIIMSLIIFAWLVVRNTAFYKLHAATRLTHWLQIHSRELDIIKQRKYYINQNFILEGWSIWKGESAYVHE